MHKTTAQKGTAIRPILLEGIGTLLDKCVERARCTCIWARMISRPRGKWSSLYNAVRSPCKAFGVSLETDRVPHSRAIVAARERRERNSTGFQSSLQDFCGAA